MNRKSVIRMTETELKNFITESVKRTIKEWIEERSEIYDVIAPQVRNGVFDDKLKDPNWVKSMFDLTDPDYDEKKHFLKAIHDRLLIIDKEYALEHMNDDDKRDIAYQREMADRSYANRNFNNLDRPYGRKLVMGRTEAWGDDEIDQGWEDIHKTRENK